MGECQAIVKYFGHREGVDKELYKWGQFTIPTKWVDWLKYFYYVAFRPRQRESSNVPANELISTTSVHHWSADMSSVQLLQEAATSPSAPDLVSEQDIFSRFQQTVWRESIQLRWKVIQPSHLKTFIRMIFSKLSSLNCFVLVVCLEQIRGTFLLNMEVNHWCVILLTTEQCN